MEYRNRRDAKREAQSGHYSITDAYTYREGEPYVICAMYESPETPGRGANKCIVDLAAAMHRNPAQPYCLTLTLTGIRIAPLQPRPARNPQPADDGDTHQRERDSRQTPEEGAACAIANANQLLDINI